jgi:cell division protease FtsH
MMDEEDMEELCEGCDIYGESNLAPDGSWKRSVGTITRFLGKGTRTEVPINLPTYYGDLLALALQRYIEGEGWKVVKIIGPNGRVPRYTNVNTDYGKYENVLSSGYLLLQKEDSRVVAFIKVRPRYDASLVISSSSKEDAFDFAKGIENYAQGRKLYQGKKLQLTAHIRFLNLPTKGWDDLALEPTLKYEIQANTVDFLTRLDELAKYGIPPRRGVILVGEPGTGKTLISKILMNHSPGITCIAAHEACLSRDSYIDDLYELAQNLKPSIVFIEDIDLVGQDREESHYMTGIGLFGLLRAMDGIEQCEGVVTIATTNSLQKLDRALTERPSRFDRKIQLSPPSLIQRRELIRSLSQRIPMDEVVQDCLTRKTEKCTPAQIQELAYSLVIEHKHGPACSELGCCRFSVDDVDNVLSITMKKNGEIGFRKVGNNGNGSGVEAISHTEVIFETQE